MAYSYSHLYGLNTTGLRFFTVYGPWGRPDMAMYIFTEKIMNGEAIKIFGHGKMHRDFTFINDIIFGLRKSMEKNYQNEIFNLGNNKTENIMDMVRIIEKYLGKRANLMFYEKQPGDVKKTNANIKYSREMLGYYPRTSIQEGIPKFIDWYLKYKNNKS